MRELIQVFLDETPDLLSRAVDAATRKDAGTMQASLHAVKGSMLFLDPRQALECAQAAEELAAGGDVESSSGKLKELQTHFRDVCSCLESYLAENQ